MPHLYTSCMAHAPANAASNGHYDHPANRLAGESSPYLLQHAHNPVDWWPWGDAAIAEARRRNVPIFLSIGYSTCYWCHVMERECFENADIAKQMNESCVNIKLDREERPDLDELYMAATVMTTGSGGWPMSVFIEPDTLRPYFCGTYFPPTSKMGRPGFPDVIRAMAEAFTNTREKVQAHASEIADAIREHLGPSRELIPAAIGATHVANAVQSLIAMHDRVQGGFGQAPKFPQPVFLEFLLDARLRAADDSTSDAIDIVLRKTLDAMALGGIFDQVGGGFHRYSVDAQWTVPHFEKMLYDNAQLAPIYSRASAILADPFFAHIARRTLDYVLREMTNPQGGFHSAQDAEVDGREGKNYVWDFEEITAALTQAGLSSDDITLAADLLGVADGPNFQDPHHRDQPATNVLRLSDRPEISAQRRGKAAAQLETQLASIHQALYAARAQRRQPRLDDKSIASWNAMMIAAFARVGRDLAEPKYIAAAHRAAQFVRAHLTDEQGRLLRTTRQGVPGPLALLEDHAAVAIAYFELVRSGHEEYLPHAKAILGVVEREFMDSATGQVFDTRDAQFDLFVRARATHDGAVPSASSLLLHAFLDAHELAQTKGQREYLGLATRSLASMAGALAQSPVGCVNATRALLRVLTTPEAADEFVVADSAPSANSSQLQDTDPVSIFAGVDRLTIARELPAETHLLIKIEDGYHVPAADPGMQGLIPFRVHIVGGTGVVAYAEYHEGDAYPKNADDPAHTHRAYQGVFDLRVALEREGEWTGRPLLAVTYQACRDDACLQPRTVELDIALDPA